MELVTVSSKGQIAIPKAVRDALNLSEGAKLTIELRGQKIILSKEPALEETGRRRGRNRSDQGVCRAQKAGAGA